MKKSHSIIGAVIMATAAHLQAQTNFIFVTIDDMSRESLGIHGCTIPEISPNLDALGRSGLRFEHCHVQSANCTPSRNIMSSGLYQQRNRVFQLGSEGAGNHHTLPALPDVFRAAGYHTGLMGKNSHMSPFDPYSGFDVEYDGYGSTRDPENIYSKLSTAFSDAAALGKPLYFNLNIFDPHTGWFNWSNSEGVFKGETNNPPSRIYTEEEIPYPSWFPPLSEAEQIDPVTGNSMKDELAAYDNTVKRADDSIGRMLDAIEDAGQTDNTILVVVSDHGLQEPGAKTQLYDHSTRSPLFVKWPGVTSSNSVDDTHMIASFDLLPTFAEMIGQPLPAGVDGRSFAPIIKGETVPKWRDYIYKQQNDRNKMRAIQTRDLLYIYNPWSDGSQKVGTVATGMLCWRQIEAAGESGTNAAAAAYAEHFLYRTVEELYDMNNDHDCLTNLVEHPAYTAELAMMQNRMVQEMADSGDNLVLNAFTNWLDTASPAANAQFITDQTNLQNEQAKDPNYTRSVFYNPHDDWHILGHTLFEPAGEWDIWTPETGGINLNSTNGDGDSGPGCIEFNGSVADVSRLIVSGTLDTSAFNQLKLDAIIIDGGALSAGATLSFQYNDGEGWKTFESTGSKGKKNLTFELPGGGLPDTMQFGILADMNGTGGSIYLDHARLSAWQDWTGQPTDAPFDASNLATVRLSFEFTCWNFDQTDKLLLEYYDGDSWELLEGYDFSYVLLTNKLYSDSIDLSAADYAFPTNLQFRFRSESTGSGQTFAISNYTIKSRRATDSTPKVLDDSYSTTAPSGIVVPPPGVLQNDQPGIGSTLEAELVDGVGHGILEFHGDGSFVYAATNGFSGPDSFTYLAYNGIEYSASTGTVSLTTQAISPPITNQLSITFGAASDLASSFNGADTTLSTVQSGSIAAPSITVSGLDIDGIGVNNDQVQAEFSVSYTGGSVSRLSAGYVFDPGETLTFDLISASVILGNGGTNASIEQIGFVSTEGNNANRKFSVTSPDPGFTPLIDVKGIQALNADPGIDGLSSFSMTGSNLDLDGNRARNIVSEFRIIKEGTAGSAISSFSEWAGFHGVSTNSEYLIDYAFNINPYLSERYKLADGGDSGLPVWEFAETEDRLVLDYLRRKQAGDLTYKVQFTDNLTNTWSDAVSGEITTPVDEAFERVSVADHVPAASAPTRFGRVIVIRN